MLIDKPDYRKIKSSLCRMPKY